MVCVARELPEGSVKPNGYLGIWARNCGVGFGKVYHIVAYFDP